MVWIANELMILPRNETLYLELGKFLPVQLCRLNDARNFGLL